MGIFCPISVLWLEFKSKEELQLMPQTVEEHMLEMEDSDTDSDSSTDTEEDDNKVGHSFCPIFVLIKLQQ